MRLMKNEEVKRKKVTEEVKFRIKEDTNTHLQ